MSKRSPKSAGKQPKVDMGLTITDLVNMKPAIEELIKMELPVKAALHVRRVVQAANAELQLFSTFVADRRKQLGTEKEGKISVLPENVEQFEKDVREAMAQKVELPGGPLSVSDLGDRVQIKPETLLALDKLLQD